MRRPALARCLACLLLVAAAGCSARAPADPPGPATAVLLPSDPADAFAAIEDRLLAAPLAIRFRVDAEGALSVALRGVACIADDARATIHATGTFGDEPVVLSLAVADGRMAGGAQGRTFDEPAAPHVREAIVLGVTRMGILHNLARLSAGRAPDRAQGGVRDWVQPRNQSWESAPGSDAAAALRQEVWVAQHHAGDAVIHLGSDGRPYRREQTVRFPGGEMRVREEYVYDARAQAGVGSDEPVCASPRPG